MHKLLNIAIEAAVAAGADILEVYESDFAVEHKDDKSPLTLADKRGHLKIMSYLENTPYPVLSEEGKYLSYDERKDWNLFWLVDPLDGTKEFIKRNGEFTVNIALIENGVPIMGVIYVPVKDILYVGSEEGAFKYETYIAGNSRKEALPLSKGNRPYTVVGSRSHMSAETELFFKEKKKEHGSVEVLTFGSSLKLCMVAEGKADAYPRYAPTMEWDTGAGHAIALAAGFNVTKYNTTEPLTYNKEDLLNPWFLVS
ncbi:MAG: 3'(2'),5'-bisphosphate nucleotidase [Flavobacteriales bacterium]|nr:3'(2'),5'-bisphosphate nucleotidase [Flavobacteriales bacterium]|tara:strand:+ start:2645 stop:3409 length:765 start_codon:yes stop_codon:yes gene_type:complete